MSRSRAAILIIENDDDVARGLAIRLEAAGFACRTAASGGQGLATFGEQAFDLVITDLHMTGGDGIAVVEGVRARGRTPVVVITGVSDAYRDRLNTLPQIACLRKPFDFEALLELVETELALAAIPD